MPLELTTSKHDKSKTVTLLYFASLRTLLGIGSESIPIPYPLLIPSEPNTDSSPPLKSTSTLIRFLPSYIISTHSGGDAKKTDEIKKVLECCLWSVNEEMIDAEEFEEGRTELKGGEVVGVMPPVSGG